MRNNLFISLIIIFFSGCTQMYTPINYSPTEFKTPNDFNVSASANFLGLSGSIAYTPFNHFFIYAEGNNMKSGSNGEKELSLAGGLGGYYAMDYSLFEIRIGYGAGNYDFADSFYGGSDVLTIARGNYSRYYASLCYLQEFERHKIGVFVNGGGLDNYFDYANIHVNPHYSILNIYSGFLFRYIIASRFRLQLSAGFNLAKVNGGLSEYVFRTSPFYYNAGISFNLKK